MDFPPLTLATPTKGGKAPLSQTPGMGLPFEIWLRILRLLERYPSALVACQQTCFDWAYPCRLMLNSISTSLLRTSSDLEALIQDIHGAPELQSIIDSLLVLPDATYHSELLNTVPLTLPAKLSKVTFMSLIGNPTTPINPMSWNLYSGFGLTERLDLDEVLVHSLADLLRVLCSLPKLSCFTGTDINWVRIGRPPSAPNKQRIRLPSFQHLHLGVYKRDSGFVTEFMRWFVGSSGVTELKTLQLHLHKPHDYSELSLILRHGQFSFLKTLEFELAPTTLTGSFSGVLFFLVLYMITYVTDFQH